MITYRNLSKSLEKVLNQQLTKEAHQAQTYLSYASWAEVKGFSGLSSFLYKHSEEERNHMYKFLRYINERGGDAKIEAIAAPPKNPETIKECVERVMQHEMDNTAAINKLVDAAHKEGDWATFNFLHWFVKEQIEEETLIKKLVDRFNVLEQSKASDLDYLGFDEELGELSQDSDIPRELSL